MDLRPQILHNCDLMLLLKVRISMFIKLCHSKVQLSHTHLHRKDFAFRKY
uniref:Light-inducible protein CPRF-2 n=1 Tax=Rhizophora mucronata TaxID=61149 RepID=A0A2P2MSE3_RHIMU